jgi:HK97 family phage prohead protease
MSDSRERRSAPVELRAKGRRLEGYAALYSVPATINGGFTEIICEGAFRGSLSGDVLALQDHDPSKVLGRTRSGTLRLSEDKRGLHFDLDLPETSHGRDVLELATRGDIGGMSFGFEALDEKWTNDMRELRSIRLHEISVVSSWPAYPDTIVNIRARTLQVLPLKLALARRYLTTLGDQP